MSKSLKSETRNIHRTRNKNPKYPSADALVTWNTMCLLNDLHYSASCTKVTNPNDRRNILIESKRCFKCLCRGHQLKDCKGQRNCSNCGGRHHQSICLGVFRESQPTDSKIKNEEASSWGSATTIATTSTKKAKGSILLQTAAAIVTNESPFPYEFCSTMAVNAHTWPNTSKRSWV